MALGPGKYDEECREMLDRTKADATLLLVLGGVKGIGISLTVRADKLAEVKHIPGFLRLMADQIEMDINAGN